MASTATVTMPPSGLPAGVDAAGDIHLPQHPAAENRPHSVGILGHRQHPEGNLPLRPGGIGLGVGH